MNEDPDDHVTILGNQPKRGGGVRRLNRVPLFIAGIMLLLIMGAVTYTYQMRLAEIRRKAAESGTRPEPASLNGLFDNAPDSGLIPAMRIPAAIVPGVIPVDKPTPVETPDPYGDDWERYRRELERQGELRNQRARQAIGAPTRIQNQAVGARSARPSERDDNDAPSESSAAAVSRRFAELYGAEARRQRRLARGEEEEYDLNRAAEKRAFLSDRDPQGRAANYLTGGREAPLSPYELKAGTVIPAIMVGGVISDLPGQIIGQVTQNIYDSATGRYLLIPQGAKLIGTYDNAITTGQERMLVAWTRIIYPDSSSIDLGKMPGADQSGFAGLHDKVNDHFWKMFGNALLMSVFSAGVQISQGGQSVGANGLNAQQSIAAGLGQQLGQLGQEIARRNTRIQPTLEIRPGYRFNVTVTKDIIIRPWTNGENLRAVAYRRQE